MDKGNILIIGGTGFLGGNLATVFCQTGWRVLVTVRPNSDSRRIQNLVTNGMIELVSADNASLQEVFLQKKFEAVIHTATNYGRHGETVAEIAAANIELPAFILELAKNNGCKYFINSDTFLPESLPKEDKYYQYVQTKKEFIKRAKIILAGSRIKFINARIYQMYGPDDNPDKFLPWIIKSLLSNQPSILLSPGNQARDFIYINDVVNAFAKILNHAEDFENFEDFEIGTGETLELKIVVEQLKILTASRSELMWGKRGYEPGEIMVSRAQLENNREVSWQAEVGIAEGLKQTVDYYK